MNNTIPIWYNSFSIYIDFYNEIVDVYKKISSMTFEERYNDPFKVVRPIADISTLISRIIPFKINESLRMVSFVHDENMDYLSSYLPFVGIDLIEIITHHNKLLFKLGALRNKYEHVPHSVEDKLVSGSNDASDVLFEIPTRGSNLPYRVLIGTDEIAYLIEDISKMISKVSKHIVDDIEQNHPKYLDYPYYKLLKKATKEITLV